MHSERNLHNEELCRIYSYTEHQKKRGHFQDLGLDRRIILIHILNKWGGRAGFCQNSSNNLDFIKRAKFLKQLSTYQIQNRRSVRGVECFTGLFQFVYTLGCVSVTVSKLLNYFFMSHGQKSSLTGQESDCQPDRSSLVLKWYRIYHVQ